MTDPIADMLTRIRNAQAVQKPLVEMPLSKVKKNLAGILKQEGYITDFAVVTSAGHELLQVTLKYDEAGAAAIRSIRRVSKPGLRIYAQKKVLPFVLNNLGIAIISTSHGLMTNREARKRNLGGEVVCEIY